MAIDPTPAPTEFQRGVQAAEKLWQKMFVAMSDEARFEVSCMRCQKCSRRYFRNPEQATPKFLLCPWCRKHDSHSVGLCFPATYEVQVTRGIWEVETRRARAVVAAARALIARIRTPEAAGEIPALTDALAEAAASYESVGISDDFGYGVIRELQGEDLTIPEEAVGTLQPYSVTKA